MDSTNRQTKQTYFTATWKDKTKAARRKTPLSKEFSHAWRVKFDHIEPSIYVGFSGSSHAAQHQAVTARSEARSQQLATMKEATPLEKERVKRDGEIEITRTRIEQVTVSDLIKKYGRPDPSQGELPM